MRLILFLMVMVVPCASALSVGISPDIVELDKSGKGAITTRGYQNNKRTKDYIKECQKVFKNVTIKNNIITCNN